MNVKRVFFIILVTIVFLSCGTKDEPQVSPLQKENVSGTVLWERITEEADYHTYQFWPGHEGLSPGQAPHGVFHKVYVNRPLYQALPREDKTAPNGSIIVKENYSADEELMAITVMAKVESFDPEHGDWFWAKYAPDGEIGAEGAVGGCIDCHAGMESNDYIIIQQLDLAE